MWKKIDNISYVCACGDHPIYIDYWLKKMKNHKKTYLITCDENQLNYLKKYYPHIKSHVMYEVMGNAIAPLPYMNRKYDVYFGVSYFDIKHEKQAINDLDEMDRQCAYEMIDYVLAHEGAPLEEALEYAYEKNGIVVDIDSFSSELSKYEAVDRYIRGYYRNYYISAALESDVDVTVCGNDWENSPFIGNKKFHYLEVVKQWSRHILTWLIQK